MRRRFLRTRECLLDDAAAKSVKRDMAEADVAVIRHVTLYKHGVGFFKREAQVEGDSLIELQGWALIDNTHDEDWVDAPVGVTGGELDGGNACVYHLEHPVRGRPGLAAVDSDEAVRFVVRETGSYTDEEDLRQRYLNQFRADEDP